MMSKLGKAPALLANNKLGWMRVTNRLAYHTVKRFTVLAPDSTVRLKKKINLKALCYKLFIHWRNNLERLSLLYNLALV